MPTVNPRNVDSIDLSHHLSTEARDRLPNPMKDVWRMVQSANKPDIANMANGDPHHSLYPFRKMSFEVPAVNQADPVSSWRNGSSDTQFFHSYKDQPSALSLRNAFQYTHGAGLPECQKALSDLTQFFHAPPNHAVTLTLGNSDGITKVFRMLGERGDHFLTDEFSFPGMTNAPLSYGIKWLGIKMDKGGIIPGEIERVLQHWDPRRGRRPHVLYIVPVGQNPTGTTLSLQRRKEIYAIARRWDLIIIEDDPYYFLQYDLPSVAASTEKGEFSEKFAQSLIPSLLSMDVDGRVLRIDSFSKILAPGMRLGWISSNHLFHHKLVTYTDSGPQHPHAFGQVFVTEMLGKNGWQMDGFCRWIQSLRVDYQRRRDFLLEAFRREVEPTGYASINVPEAGMFVWVTINFDRHPRYRSRSNRGGSFVAPRTNTEVLLRDLFKKFMDFDVVLMPSAIFAMEEDPLSVVSPHHIPIRDRINSFRGTFAGTEETIEKGMIRLGRALREFFEETADTSHMEHKIMAHL